MIEIEHWYDGSNASVIHRYKAHLIKLLWDEQFILIFVIVNFRLESIHTVDYDGKNAHLVLKSHPEMSHPFAMSLFGTYVYWTDWRSNSVVRVSVQWFIWLEYHCTYSKLKLYTQMCPCTYTRSWGLNKIKVP